MTSFDDAPSTFGMGKRKLPPRRMTFEERQLAAQNRFIRNRQQRQIGRYVVDQASKIRPSIFWKPSFDFSRAQDMVPKVEDKVSVELNDRVRFRL